MGGNGPIPPLPSGSSAASGGPMDNWWKALIAMQIGSTVGRMAGLGEPPQRPVFPEPGRLYLPNAGSPSRPTADTAFRALMEQIQARRIGGAPRKFF